MNLKPVRICPYKPKKSTRAAIAREKGLEPLAKIIMAGKVANCCVPASRFVGKEGVGGLDTIRDIVMELKKPGRDPRIDGDNDAFVPGVESFDDIRVGMVLPGLVSDITAFGAFVNLGIKENGLVHISQMSRKRIGSVSEVLKPGGKVDVRVIEVDTARRRISLSLLL